VGHVRQVGQPDPDLRGRDHSHDVLALAADVEEAAAEGERDGEAGQDQRRRHDQRLLEVQSSEVALFALHPREEPVQPGPVEDRLVGV
jgi:hypothetical protein